MDTSVTGVVLAGGASTRFSGRHKALATFRGERFIERALDTLKVITDVRPVVVLRTSAQRTLLETHLDDVDSVRFAYDDRSFAGPIAGLYGALEAIETPWIFACGCDMPLLAPELLRWLRDRLSVRSPDAVVPVNEDGSVEPLHAFYRRSAFVGARSQLSPTDGVRSLLTYLGDVEYLSPGDVPEESTFTRSLTNINTREELRRIECQLMADQSRRVTPGDFE